MTYLLSYGFNHSRSQQGSLVHVAVTFVRTRRAEFSTQTAKFITGAPYLQNFSFSDHRRVLALHPLRHVRRRRRRRGVHQAVRENLRGHR